MVTTGKCVFLSSLNLSRLKELSLMGNNHIWNKQYLLTDQYKRVLGFLLTYLNSASIKVIRNQLFFISFLSPRK